MKNQKKYIILILVTVFISLIALLGTSYAILTMKLTSSKKISIVTGVLRVDFNDGEFIKLENEAPTTDEKALAKTPYTFTIENTGNLDAYYKISMEEELTNTLDKKYLKMRLTSDNGYDSGVVKLSDYESNNYDITDIATLKTTDNKITYNLWLWLGTNATNDAQGKEYKSKIVVTSYDREPEQNETVTLAAGLYYKDGTFKSWDELDNENISENQIHSGAFGLETGLAKIVISDSIVEINTEVIMGCDVEEVYIPNSVTIINDYAFADCDSLTTIYYSGTATGAPWGSTTATVKPYPKASEEKPVSLAAGLYDANNIMIVSWSESGIDNNCSNARTVLQNYPQVTKIVISDSVTSIGASTFSSCSNLTSIIIPDSVTSIGAGAFSSCTSLTSIYIPTSVTTITIMFNSVNSSPFYGCSESLVIYCGASEAQPGWATYWNYCSSGKMLTVNYNITREQYEAII